jgi:hypothetical protein
MVEHWHPSALAQLSDEKCNRAFRTLEPPMFPSQRDFLPVRSSPSSCSWQTALGRGAARRRSGWLMMESAWGRVCTVSYGINLNSE